MRILGAPPGSPLELWAGVECTVNRVGDVYFDQIERSGHAGRIDDLDRLAGLGASAVRYPVLWERTAPAGLDGADWSWADARLARLREVRVRPIVGLVHHGSGPRHTSLLDPGFADGLAEFAGAVARRYPWVEDFTPVNEPLTTSRFSALYGHWYPHAADDTSFLRALVIQLRGVVLAMRAIREVTPGARLVQTEDFGKTYSTPSLAYQAAFDNERRWLTFDLLCGRMDGGHPLWGYLRGNGVSEADLAFFRENPCPPDVVGINHYLTSERFLDHRVRRYPPHTHGGNGRDAYADLEAVRVCAEGAGGVYRLLPEVWDRYGLPIAVTEAHLGCTREEQMRWLRDVWCAAEGVRAGGVDVRAVTLWSALGAYDWNSLVTRDEGVYEPGAFDLRAPEPRPTGLAALARDLAAGRTPGHAVLDAPGWWRRLDRLLYPPVRREHGGVHTSGGLSMTRRPARPILIAGATGTLGRAFARVCELRGLAFRLLSRGELDIADGASIAGALELYEPWAVVNAAGYVRVDDAERDAARCMRENADGPALLAAACAGRGVRLLTVSSDLVFDGAKGAAYVESDPVAPLNVYGRSKAEAERRVLEAMPLALVVRTSAFFGPWDEHNFVAHAFRALEAGERFPAASDAVVSPTYVPDLVNAALDLLIDGDSGLWHLANEGAVAWADFARMAAEGAGLDPALVEPVPAAELRLAAPRPARSALASERASLMPPLADALARYVGDAGLGRGACAGPALAPAREGHASFGD